MNASTLARHARGQARPPRFFTVAEVADHLRVADRTVRRWIAAGELNVHRFGAAVRISERDLHAFVALRQG